MDLKMDKCIRLLQLLVDKERETEGSLPILHRTPTPMIRLSVDPDQPRLSREPSVYSNRD